MVPNRAPHRIKASFSSTWHFFEVLLFLLVKYYNNSGEGWIRSYLLNFSMTKFVFWAVLVMSRMLKMSVGFPEINQFVQFNTLNLNAKSFNSILLHISFEYFLQVLCFWNSCLPTVITLIIFVNMIFFLLIL